MKTYYVSWGWGTFFILWKFLSVKENFAKGVEPPGVPLNYFYGAKMKFYYASSAKATFFILWKFLSDKVNFAKGGGAPWSTPELFLGSENENLLCNLGVSNIFYFMKKFVIWTVDEFMYKGVGPPTKLGPLGRGPWKIFSSSFGAQERPDSKSVLIFCVRPFVWEEFAYKQTNRQTDRITTPWSAPELFLWGENEIVLCKFSESNIFYFMKIFVWQSKFCKGGGAP